MHTIFVVFGQCVWNLILFLAMSILCKYCILVIWKLKQKDENALLIVWHFSVHLVSGCSRLTLREIYSIFRRLTNQSTFWTKRKNSNSLVFFRIHCVLYCLVYFGKFKAVFEKKHSFFCDLSRKKIVDVNFDTFYHISI